MNKKYYTQPVLKTIHLFKNTITTSFYNEEGGDQLVSKRNIWGDEEE